MKFPESNIYNIEYEEDHPAVPRTRQQQQQQQQQHKKELVRLS
jgi:hypothetical protein